jgi:hypothetical protein
LSRSPRTSRRPLLAFVTGSTLAGSLLLGVTGPANAQDHLSPASFPVTMTIKGPSVLTADSTYTVTLSGTTHDVCGVIETATKREDLKAPYTVPVSLSSLPAGRPTLTVYAVGCSVSANNTRSVYGVQSKTVTVPVHVTTATRWVAPDAQIADQRSLHLSVTGMTTGVSAKIVKGGTTVATLARRTTRKATWTWAPGKIAAGNYTLSVRAGGHTVTLPLGIARGWAPFNPPFTRCTTLTWSYSDVDQPDRASGMVDDVTDAFSRITAATGIAFKQVPAKGAITLGWSTTMKDADGTGGATTQGGRTISGQVLFNASSEWVGHAGFGRYDGGLPERGALISHEIGHALGLAHVTDRNQLMYPTATTGSPTAFGSGDLAGLNALYRAKSC